MKNKKPGWIQKCERDERENKNLRLPTQVLSNEEFIPFEQTAEQKRVENNAVELSIRLDRGMNGQLQIT